MDTPLFIRNWDLQHQNCKEIISPNYMIRFEMDSSPVELQSENVSCWHFDCKALNKGHIFVWFLTPFQKQSEQNMFCCRTSKSVVRHQQTDNKTHLKNYEAQSYYISQADFKLIMLLSLPGTCSSSPPASIP